MIFIKNNSKAYPITLSTPVENIFLDTKITVPETKSTLTKGFSIPP